MYALCILAIEVPNIKFCYVVNNNNNALNAPPSRIQNEFLLHFFQANNFNNINVRVMIIIMINHLIIFVVSK